MTRQARVLVLRALGTSSTERGSHGRATAFDLAVPKAAEQHRSAEPRLGAVGRTQEERRGLPTLVRPMACARPTPRKAVLACGCARPGGVAPARGAHARCAGSPLSHHISIQTTILLKQSKSAHRRAAHRPSSNSKSAVRHPARCEAVVPARDARRRKRRQF